ncbi:VOC family protein [Roseimaritima ulvae]|uniref:Metallothiol transferase FosB n=1 Tax=Roseimaritima ulvae TaxID=980254 RepID=A0A5B9QUK2_9BACT|nr:VOC family protein [Roseimaritima ulvae]QEG41085.1 Metallothiol transferase FosB [Roseimaritima ulvae]
MKTLQLNHVALHVADVQRSAAFYRDVLMLEPMPRPAFDFPGAWFRIGVDQELHLIGDRTADVHSHHRGTHFAMQVDDMQAWDQHLSSDKVPGLQRTERKTRPDGAEQIFVTDPDGHWVELCKLAD